MKYNPLPNMKVKDVELINQLSQILENRLIGRTDLKDHKYLAINPGGFIWVYSVKPILTNINWRHLQGTACKCIKIKLPPNIIRKIDRVTFQSLLFELGEKEREC